VNSEFFVHHSSFRIHRSKNDSALEGLADGFGFGVNVEFGVDAADVFADRPNVNVEVISHRLVGRAFG
jgi:hypothetical protein